MAQESKLVSVRKQVTDVHDTLEYSANEVRDFLLATVWHATPMIELITYSIKDHQHMPEKVKDRKHNNAINSPMTK